MLKTLFTIIGLFFLIIVPTYSISNIEPSVQCTIIKVYETVQILGFTKFPELYQSINNDPTKSTLIIAEKKFTNLIPKTISKTEIFEKILIKHKSGQLELEINGKPISRNGYLKESGKLIADITCH